MQRRLSLSRRLYTLFISYFLVHYGSKSLGCFVKVNFFLLFYSNAFSPGNIFCPLIDCTISINKQCLISATNTLSDSLTQDRKVYVKLCIFLLFPCYKSAANIRWLINFSTFCVIVAECGQDQNFDCGAISRVT
jgi:hypothetical protein